MTNSGTHHHHNRGTWNNKADFILALISYGVGLGNVWR
jgi:SNF family Na+-dependent transporter